jgi:ABC-type transport system involved in multi-copper enzyme maturation permease subunit
MTRIIHAELLRMLRRRPLVAMGVFATLFAAVAAITVFAGAPASGTPVNRGTTLEALAGSGGGTEAFATAASFAGFFVFVTFIALIATEFSGGTFRALLLRDPHRLRVIVGKLLGLLVVAAGVVALIEVLTFVASLIMAPTQSVSTADWFSLGSLGDAARDFGTVFAGVAGWAVFGTTLAVVFRSVPLALAVGFAWAGPFENIVVDSWDAGYRYFPGQVLASLIRGGTPELAFDRAVVTATIYTAVAGAVGLVLVSRRDVTS